MSVEVSSNWRRIGVESESNEDLKNLMEILEFPKLCIFALDQCRCSTARGPEGAGGKKCGLLMCVLPPTIMGSFWLAASEGAAWRGGGGGQWRRKHTGTSFRLAYHCA